MRHMNTIRIRSLLLVAGALCALTAPIIFGSCTPGNSITAAESDVVVTIFDRDFGFGSQGTYAMIDSIIHITGDPDETDSPLLSRNFDSLAISQIHAKMRERNYTRVSTADSAEVVILLGATATENYNATSWYPWYGGWGYWGGWPCCYGGGWGWYYPPTVSVSYAYTSGTLFVIMIDPKSADPDQELLGIVWNGAINGVLDDTSASKQSRIKNSINQMFVQSPYLRTSN